MDVERETMDYTGQLPIHINISYPTPYSESLSYLEYLALLHTKMNELIDLMNSYQTNYITYTDEQINLLREELDTRFNGIVTLINNNDESIRSLIASQKVTITNEYTSLINSNTNTLNSRITNEIALVNGRITLEINQVIAYINSGFINVQVLNPVTGQVGSIQDALNSLSEQFRVNALTCTEYDALDLTCTEYDALDLTVYEYDYNGITI